MFLMFLNQLKPLKTQASWGINVLMFLIQKSQVSSLGLWSLCVFIVFNVFKSIKNIKNIKNTSLSGD